jgi:predicted nucleic acid-binding protein
VTWLSVTSLSEELRLRHLLVDDPRQMTAMLDADVPISLLQIEQTGRQPPACPDGFQTPHDLVRDLGRTGVVAMSYWAFQQSIDIAREHALSEEKRRQMVQRLDVLRKYDVRVLKPIDNVMALAMDMWFAVRQQELEGIHLSDGLSDQYIAATAILSGVRLYTANCRHFRPYVERFQLDLICLERVGQCYRIPSAG